ncbi:hypothetical protein L3Y34_009747 [Caenorhabditis briggsae]|uniref:Uncharacterized protein n=1 Tax=Caenorhabditis briggsae TaxID=6238 RepID=A0AAE9A6D7_CAEBR|nr:hypothetical protein L3Y34_009747 [Caenorhabditis briggsae]
MPNVHITESSFIVFSVLKNEKFGKDFGPIAITIYCSCYAMMLSLLSIHFFYRYTSVTAPMWLSNRFSSKSSIFWFLFVFVYSTIWGCSSYFLCKPTENKDRELLREFMKEYCMKPEEYAYNFLAFSTAKKIGEPELALLPPARQVLYIK